MLACQYPRRYLFICYESLCIRLRRTRVSQKLIHQVVQIENIFSRPPRLSELLEQNPQRQRAVQQKDQIREKLRIQIQIEGREKIHGHEAARKAKQAQKDDVNHNQNACR